MKENQQNNMDKESLLIHEHIPTALELLEGMPLSEDMKSFVNQFREHLKNNEISKVNLKKVIKEITDSYGVIDNVFQHEMPRFFAHKYSEMLEKRLQNNVNNIYSFKKFLSLEADKLFTKKILDKETLYFIKDVIQTSIESWSISNNSQDLSVQTRSFLDNKNFEIEQFHNKILDELKIFSQKYIHYSLATSQVTQKNPSLTQTNFEKPEYNKNDLHYKNITSFLKHFIKETAQEGILKVQKEISPNDDDVPSKLNDILKKDKEAKKLTEEELNKKKLEDIKKKFIENLNKNKIEETEQDKNKKDPFLNKDQEFEKTYFYTNVEQLILIILVSDEIYEDMKEFEAMSKKLLMNKIDISN